MTNVMAAVMTMMQPPWLWQLDSNEGDCHGHAMPCNLTRRHNDYHGCCHAVWLYDHGHDCDCDWITIDDPQSTHGAEPSPAMITYMAINIAVSQWWISHAVLWLKEGSGRGSHVCSLSSNWFPASACQVWHRTIAPLGNDKHLSWSVTILVHNGGQ